MNDEIFKADQPLRKYHDSYKKTDQLIKNLKNKNSIADSKKLAEEATSIVSSRNQSFYEVEDSGFKKNDGKSLSEVVSEDLETDPTIRSVLGNQYDTIRGLANLQVENIKNDGQMFRGYSSETKKSLSELQNIMTYEPTLSYLINQEIIQTPLIREILQLDADDLSKLGYTTGSIGESLVSGNSKIYYGSYEEDDFFMKTPWSEHVEASELPVYRMNGQNVFSYTSTGKDYGWATERSYENARDPNASALWSRLLLKGAVKERKGQFLELLWYIANGFASLDRFKFTNGPTNVTNAAVVKSQGSITLSDGLLLNDLYTAHPAVAGKFHVLKFLTWLRDEYLFFSENRKTIFTKLPSVLICNSDVVRAFIDARLPVTDKTVSVGSILQGFGVSIQLPDIVQNINLTVAQTSQNLNKRCYLVSPNPVKEYVISGSELQEVQRDILKGIINNTFRKSSLWELDLDMTRWAYDYTLA